MASLTIGQNLVCIFIGMSSLIIGYLIKQIPESLFEHFDLFSEDRGVDVDPNTLEGRTRRPSTLLRKKRQLENYKVQLEKKTHKDTELRMVRPK